MGFFSKKEFPTEPERRNNVREPQFVTMEFGKFLRSLGKVSQETRQGLDLTVLGDALLVLGQGRSLTADVRQIVLDVLRRNLEDSEGINERAIIRCASSIMNPVRVELFSSEQSSRPKHWLIGLSGEEE